jgi:L-iditol 2-dehydrogenase
MRALVKEAVGVRLRSWRQPSVDRPHDVLVRVVVAGVCRTDLFVADDRIASATPVVLGHELAGIVAEVGPAAEAHSPGDRVTVMPLIPPHTLGIDRDGAFAEYVLVPSFALHRVPTSMPFVRGAMVEPVAACLSVVSAGISPRETTLICGGGRIAALTQRVLAAYGFPHLQLHDPVHDARPPAGSFDVVVDSSGTADGLTLALDAVRPRGRIVLKSRPSQPIPFDVRTAVLKEVTLHAVNYAPFPDAVALLASPGLVIDDLLGPVRPLEAWERVFADARRDESAKQFFGLSDEATR